MENLESYRIEFIKGNNGVLKELYLKYHDDVVNVIRSKSMIAHEEIESFFNECLLQFYDQVISNKISQVKSIKNYLIGICINLIKREHLVKSKYEKKKEQIRLHLYNESDHSHEESNSEELIKLIKKEILNMSLRCQQIITAYYVDALSMKEIANYFNLSSSDVAKTMKSRCFKTLTKNVNSIVK